MIVSSQIQTIAWLATPHVTLLPLHTCVGSCEKIKSLTVKLLQHVTLAQPFYFDC